MNDGPARHWVLATLLSLLGRPRAWIWLAATAVTGVVLATRPLFDVLGFEWAFAMAAVGSVAGADLGSAFVATARRLPAGAIGNAPAHRTLFSLAVGATAAGLSTLVLPIIIICANGLRVRNCDWAFGFETAFGLTVLSTALASTLGATLRVIAGDRRVIGNLLPFLAILASALGSIYQFYGAPAVFSYNPFVGYFPGNLYDEDIELGATFWWARAYHLSLLMTALGLAAVALDTRASARLRVARPTRAGLIGKRVSFAIATLAILSGGVLWQNSASLGFHITAADVAQELGGRRETEHFIIYYPRGGEIERDMDLIAADHEFRLHQVVSTLEVQAPRKITSFYFRDPAQKARLMGARNVYMAKPWRNEIYIHHQAFPHDVLRHELVHVVAGGFGDSIFGVSARTVAGIPLLFNVGLIEGIAVAVDWPDHFTRALTPHQSVKAMTQLGFAPPITKLLSTGFLSFSSARSYTTAGSFVRFLLDTYGAAPLRRLYQTGGDFAAAYQVGLHSLVADWKTMISATELPADAAAQVREQFRARSIFERPCPHAIARARRLAREAAAKNDLPRAIGLLRDVCGNSPGEPRHLLELAAVLPLSDSEADTEEAIAILADISGDAEQVSSTLRAEAFSIRAAISARAGDWAGAEAALALAAALPLGDDAARILEAQLIAVRHRGAARDALRDYFWPPDDTADAVAQLGRAARARAAEPTLGLAHYLVAWNLAGHTTPAEAIAPIMQALDLGLPSPRFERAAARALAALAFRAGDNVALARAVAILRSPDQTEVTRLLGADWEQRITFR